jgi:Orn/Lys/Arg decarboxylase-like protein
MFDVLMAVVTAAGGATRSVRDTKSRSDSAAERCDTPCPTRLTRPHPSDDRRLKTNGRPGAVAWVRLPREAYLGATEMVDWRKAPGRISAEMVCPYPPGIPVIAPGERLTQEIVDYLEAVVAAGAMVEGAADESLAQLRVVAR